MQLAEPMTLATDYVLAALGLGLGRRLWRLGEPDAPARWWAGAFWAMAGAAFAGGTSHGFAPWLGDGANAWLWRATMVSLGLASALLAYAVVRTLGGGPAWRWILGLELAAYAIWVVAVDSDFRWAVAQYGAALLLVLVVHAALAARGRPGAGWVVGGVLVSVVAAWIQQAGIAPHPSFNHNDLYHVVQMLGLWLLYRGAARAATGGGART